MDKGMRREMTRGEQINGSERNVGEWKKMKVLVAKG
jgi:hypothetical protein